ncbi:MAG: multicopper oxidase family protein [Gemmatimonadota bacterium]
MHLGHRLSGGAILALAWVTAAGAWAPVAGQTVEDARCPMDIPRPDSPERRGTGAPPPAWDLRCIELIPAAAGGDARGVVTLERPPSPFGVTVTPEGRHIHRLSVRVEGLPDPASLGPYTTFVAWATPLALDPVVPLGAVGEGTSDLGEIAFGKYLVWISAESSADVTEREGPLVLRGRSPSSFMEAHDLLALAPAAEESGGRDPRGAAGGAPGDAHAGHAGGGMAAAGDSGWAMPPGYERVQMLPGMMTLEPDVAPLRVEAAEDAGPPPMVRPREVVRLPDGGTLDLTAGFVRKQVGGLEIEMLAFNGQHPGPLIQVAANTTIFVNFTNDTPFPTAIHWHGIRLDNAFDGVPGVTQEAVSPGGRFQYRIHFPDEGIYWYHPHHREDVQQELGLYGNLRVDPPDPGAWSPVHREEVLMLDDLLLDERGVVPFGAEGATHALMGRFGNMLLVNGEPDYRLDARPGEVVRFFLTNAANTRTFNLSLQRADELGDGAEDRAGATGPAQPDGRPPPDVLPLKVVATDVGRFERESRAESVVLGPAERYVVDVRFPEAGSWVLVNHVQGINHRQGLFLEERTELGRVTVAGEPPPRDLTDAFLTLREHEDVIQDIDRVRDRFDDPVTHELVMELQADSLPMTIEQSMRYDWAYFNPVEWTGTMPMMNWAVSARSVRWVLRDVRSGRENMDIDWRFDVGDVVKLRVHNDRTSFHAMQHPLHIHGQRFLVLSQNGIPNEHLGWKDTVLLPAGSTTDILLEISNPGRWMVHCHIAEHLEAGMRFVFDVEGGS